MIKYLSLLGCGLIVLALRLTSADTPPPAPRVVEDADVSATAAPILDPADARAGRDDNARVREAVERGLAYLAEKQDLATGSWYQNVGFKFNDRYEVTAANKPHVGVTALALMAFLANGQTPGRGKYGNVVERGTDFVLSCVDEDTGFISAYETRMYSHAFASLFLAEIFGMTRRPDLQAKLQHAIDLTVQTQNQQGAWRYRPYAPDSDMSIAVCQLMALRAARNIGIQVPKGTIVKAYEYIQNSAYGVGSQRGAFKYQIDQPETRVSFALTAAGLASLIHAGYYDDDMIKPGIRWLKQRISELRRYQHENYPTYFYWYGHYYAAQVMFIAGDESRDRELWDGFYWPRIRDELLQNQQPNGSWRNYPGPGDSFSTAIACIILQIPYQYLPIFQR
ncbi:MAG: prenyltransferase [Planctomycetes bacterium]|nr:prenyltransferase [Planctomycetota bacterium]